MLIYQLLNNLFRIDLFMAVSFFAAQTEQISIKQLTCTSTYNSYATS